MTPDLAGLIAMEQAAALARRPTGSPTTGIRFDADGLGEATFTCTAPERDSGLDRILAERFPGVNVELLEVLELRAWDSGPNAQQYVKARVRKAGPNLLTAAQADDLRRAVRRWKPGRWPARPASDRSLVVCPSDWQLGLDYEPLGGPAETAARIKADWQRVADLVRNDGPYNEIVLVSCGDLIEQCWGNYPAQQFTTTLSLTDQLKLAQELLMAGIRMLAPLVPRLTVTAVASNHGEVRLNGKAATVPGDSFDLLLLWQVARLVAANPDLGERVRVLEPPDPLVAQFELHGVRFAAIHGHQLSGSGTPAAKAWRWWDGQAANRLLDVEVLITAHYHHYWADTAGDRHAIGVPANEAGSRWLRDRHGIWSRPALLTLDVDPSGITSTRLLTHTDELPDGVLEGLPR